MCKNECDDRSKHTNEFVLEDNILYRYKVIVTILWKCVNKCNIFILTRIY